MDYMEMLLHIHTGLPREGPGCFDSTKKAFGMIRDLPEYPDILDIGCGPGMQTIDLAGLTKGNIHALDYYQKYLDELKEKIDQKGLHSRVALIKGDMTNLQFEAKSYNLIWSEGAIYIMGFEIGLKAWKPFLKDKGCIAVTEATWLRPNQPKEARKFWEAAYPEMVDVKTNLQTIEKCGYKNLGNFIVPRSGWWNDYYKPLEKRLAQLREEFKDDAYKLKFLDMEQAEINLYRKYSDFYGYVFYVMQAQ